jgi:hypothetical protein
MDQTQKRDQADWDEIEVCGECGYVDGDHRADCSLHPARGTWKTPRPWELPPPTPEEVRRNTERFEQEDVQRVGEWKNRKLAEEVARREVAA